MGFYARLAQTRCCHPGRRVSSLKNNQRKSNVARGGKREGAGRPKGSASRKTREVADKAANEGLTPLEYMLKVLRDKESSDDDKRWAAERAAPYIHPRLTAVDHSGDMTVRHEDRLKDLE